MTEPTRICNKCGIRQPLETGFYRKADRRGRPYYSRGCRTCASEYMREWKRERSEYVQEFKVSRGCMDCGLRLDRPEVYDLDHRPGEAKVDKVSMLVNVGTLEQVIAECAKCDVVCANCHRIRTEDRRTAGIGFTPKFWDLRRKREREEVEEYTLFDLPA